MQKCFYSNIEFRNQFIVSAIKFGESLSKFMRPIALFECPSIRGSFPGSNFRQLTDFFKLCIGIDIGEECYGIANGLILFKNNRVMALDLCKKCVFPNIFRINGQTSIKFVYALMYMI